MVCHSTVRRLQRLGSGWAVRLSTTDPFAGGHRGERGGLHACALGLRTEGLDPRHVPRPWYAMGSYFMLAGRSPFQRLVYPASEPDRHLAGAWACT